MRPDRTVNAIILILSIGWLSRWRSIDGAWRYVRLFDATPLSSPWPLTIAIGLISTIACYASSLYGVRWDEHYLAYGAYLFAHGFIPYRDFGMPTGPVPLIVQSFGNFLPLSLLYQYGVGAALLNGLLIGGIVRFALSIKLRWEITLLMALLAHFLFLGMAGAIWYNQSAAALFMIALLFIINGLDQIKPPSLSLAVLPGICAGLALLCKQDQGVLVLVSSSILFLIGNTHNRIMMLATLWGVALATTAIILGVFILMGAEPGFWILHGQPGFVNRLDKTHIDDMFHMFFRDGQLVVEEAALFAGAFLVFFSRNPSNCRQQLVVLAALACTLGTTIVFASLSGRGSGFATFHLDILSLLLLALLLKRQELHLSKRGGILLVVLALLSLSSIASTIIRDIERQPFDEVLVGPMKGYHSGPQTIELLTSYDRLVRDLEHKLGRRPTAMIRGIYQFVHPSLQPVTLNGPLWWHQGVTYGPQHMGPLLQQMYQMPPDILLIMPTVEPATNADLWEKLKPWIEKNYHLALSGNVDIIGSGGATNSLPIEIYTLNVDN